MKHQYICTKSTCLLSMLKYLDNFLHQHIIAHTHVLKLLRTGKKKSGLCKEGTWYMNWAINPEETLYVYNYGEYSCTALNSHYMVALTFLFFANPSWSSVNLQLVKAFMTAGCLLCFALNFACHFIHYITSKCTHSTHTL